MFCSAPDFNQSPFEFVHVVDASLVYKPLLEARNIVVDRVQVGAVWRLQIRRDEVRGSGSHVAAAEWCHGRSGLAYYITGRLTCHLRQT